MNDSSCPLDLVLQLARVRARLVRDMESATAGYHGIGLGDLALLRELVEAPDGRLRRTELARRMGITPSAIARQLGPLERIGLVAREANPKDARLALVVLTDSGRRTADEAGALARERAELLVARLWSTQERSELTRLLRAATTMEAVR